MGNAVMTTPDLFERLGLALAIGLLFGVERGWQEREAKPGARAAGIRTLALVGLLGGVWALLAQFAGGVAMGLAALAFAGWYGFFQWREERAAGSYSVTGYVAGFLAFSLGAYAVAGDRAAAGSAAVVATVVLAERRALHGFLERLKWIELRAALMLLVMSVVLLPVLPDRPVDPWGALNPYRIWLLTVLTAAISYGGYIAVKYAGGRNGLLFGGASGGLVSSTTVTWTFARLAGPKSAARRELAAGVAASWFVSVVRMTALALLVAPTLVLPLGAPAGAAALVILAAAGLIYRRAGAEPDGSALDLSDPFDIRVVLQFSAILAFVMLAAKLLTTAFGPGGAFGLAGVSGLVDVDPITLSMARQTASGGPASAAAVAILIAGGSNLLAKCALALFFGGPRFAAPLIATALAAAGAALAAALAVVA